MNKIKIAAIMAGVLLLAGCGNKAINDQSQNQEQAQEKAQGGVISSIKDAMGLGKAMKCDYKFKGEGGDITSTAYVNGKKYKAESTVMGKKQIVIFDETAMYSWAEGEKTGMKMEKTCMEEVNKNLPKGDTTSTPSAKTDEEYFNDATDVSCVPYSGTDFSVPTDITFTDQCEMLRGMMKNLPAGVNIPANIPTP